MRITKTAGLTILALTLLASAAVAGGSQCVDPAAAPAGQRLAAGQGPLQVGEYVNAAFESPHPYGAPGADAPVRVFTQEIHHPGATYVAPYFSRFELAPGDYVVVRSPDGRRTWRYERYGKAELGRQGGFWGIHVSGDRAIIELYAKGERNAFGFTIDRYARGFTAAEMGEDADESICTTDDKENAICYELSEPAIYDKGRAVSRLLIQGAFLCTGWLIGDDGHLMTNQHCIGTAADAMNTDYEFMAEGATCEEFCGQLQCDGVIEADSATLIKTSVPWDYSMVLLPVNVTPTYGFMQLRATGPVLEERIYAPQHPGGRGKEIAVFSTYPENPSGFAEMDTLTAPTCSGGGIEAGYWMDTEGGSSGSPVLGYSDHLVVALHHCRGANFCTTGNPDVDDHNRGLLIQDVIADLGVDLPDNALGNPDVIFTDGFESGDLSAWSGSVP